MSGIIDKVSQGEYLKAWRQFKDEQIGEISGKEYRESKEEEAKAKARQEFSKALGEQG